jgi:hypothetical protein
MSALSEGLLSGFAGAMQGADEWIKDDAKKRHEMTLEEYRHQKAMELQRLSQKHSTDLAERREKFEREQGSINFGNEIGKLGIQEQYKETAAEEAARRAEEAADAQADRDVEVARRKDEARAAVVSAEEEKNANKLTKDSVTIIEANVVPDIAGRLGLPEIETSTRIDKDHTEGSDVVDGLGVGSGSRPLLSGQTTTSSKRPESIVDLKSQLHLAAIPAAARKLLTKHLDKLANMKASPHMYTQAQLSAWQDTLDEILSEVEGTLPVGPPAPSGNVPAMQTGLPEGTSVRRTK